MWIYFSRILITPRRQIWGSDNVCIYNNKIWDNKATHKKGKNDKKMTNKAETSFYGVFFIFISWTKDFSDFYLVSSMASSIFFLSSYLTAFSGCFNCHFFNFVVILHFLLNIPSGIDKLSLIYYIANVQFKKRTRGVKGKAEKNAQIKYFCSIKLISWKLFKGWKVKSLQI